MTDTENNQQYDNYEDNNNDQQDGYYDQNNEGYENQSGNYDDMNFDDLEKERQRLENELGITQKITQSERLIQKKNWEHVDELGGLEIDNNLVCDLEDHDREKILFVCKSPYCDAPRRLCCGYCNPLHATHLKHLNKLQNFRDTSLNSRVKLQNTLADFTQFERKQLIEGSLLQLIKKRQKEMLDQFIKFQNNQYNSLLKLLDGATENYLFEEMSLLKSIGGFHQKVDDIFGKEWQELKSDDVMSLIRLHEHLNEFVDPINKLDENRARLAKDLTDTIDSFFNHNEVLVSTLEQQSENRMQEILDKVYKENLENKPVAYQLSERHKDIIESSAIFQRGYNTEGSTNGSPTKKNQSKEFHSVLLKDDHAPKAGWKEIQKLPLWAKYLRNVELCSKKYGQFKKQKDLPNTMDFTTLGPLEDNKGDIYIGQWRQGLRWGQGTMIWKNGTYYEGTWQKSKMEGYGRKVFKNGNMYEGEFKDDKMNGKGVFYHVGGSKYEGEWKDDLPHGRGVEVMINNDVFEGEFKKGLKEGRGRLKGADGSLITGIWQEGKLQGKGEQLYADGRLYQGDFKDDKKEGEGVLTWNDGRKYEGPWVKGRQHGIGIFINPDGTKLKGEWINGNRIRWITPSSVGGSQNNLK
ncbi:MORN motif protein (macronuclear) [Tetrahymena thermophila SB210]|uniref:MORN motif protein n=1 Tax=Tetrahymena thermophila (strain SB210) TaxID=312017 RepID=Q23KH2_TETTS|nr:MORN motif protein [Tetrahymena thermophila SB210]EAR96871.1 MORN motif protein [Tetrahymena thermophila SB210]|eukprot:XP_001017116.1 MORN motif protein [Tetrahymena thermophila SB210]